MGWAGRVARMEERRGVYSILGGEPEEKNHMEDPDVDGSIILRWILFFEPCIMIQLCNVNQQNAHF